MESLSLSRKYLESLSSVDLVSLADEYGIDIPENLTRRFIIGELLEAAEEANEKNFADLQENDSAAIAKELPLSYNETQISVVMRNPVWCYVYWDIKETDLRAIQSVPSFITMLLRISFFSLAGDDKPSGTFDIPVALDIREQYVLLHAGEYAFSIELVAEFRSVEPRHLAYSGKKLIPQGCPDVSSASLEKPVSKVLELSGLPDLMRTHYLNHRQSFS